MPRQTSRGKMTVRMKVPSPRKHSYRGATNVYRGSGSSPKKRSYTKKTSPRCGSRSSPRCGRSYRGSSSPKRRTYRGTTYRSSSTDSLFEELASKVTALDTKDSEALSGLITTLRSQTANHAAEIEKRAAEVEKELKYEQKKTSFFSKLRGNTVSGGQRLLAAMNTLETDLASTKGILEVYLNEKARKVKLMDELETQILSLKGLERIQELNKQAQELGQPPIEFNGLEDIIENETFVATVEQREDFKKWIAMPSGGDDDLAAKTAKDEARIAISNALIKDKQAQLDELIRTTDEALSKLKADKAAEADAAKKVAEKAEVMEKLEKCSNDGAGDVQECESLIAQARELGASDDDLQQAEAYVAKKKAEAAVPPTAAVEPAP